MRVCLSPFSLPSSTSHSSASSAGTSWSGTGWCWLLSPLQWGWAEERARGTSRCRRWSLSRTGDRGWPEGPSEQLSRQRLQQAKTSTTRSTLKPPFKLAFSFSPCSDQFQVLILRSMWLRRSQRNRLRRHEWAYLRFLYTPMLFLLRPSNCKEKTRAQREINPLTPQLVCESSQFQFLSAVHHMRVEGQKSHRWSDKLAEARQLDSPAKTRCPRPRPRAHLSVWPQAQILLIGITAAGPSAGPV